MQFVDVGKDFGPGSHGSIKCIQVVVSEGRNINGVPLQELDQGGQGTGLGLGVFQPDELVLVQELVGAVPVAQCIISDGEVEAGKVLLQWTGSIELCQLDGIVLQDLFHETLS